MTLERVLVEAILPFWRSRAVDRIRGGYHLHHDLAGRDLGPAPRHITAQTRTLWFFARIARSRWGRPADLEAAQHGFAFLAERLWDPRHGGFAWEVLANGEPHRPDKHALAQTAAIVALGAYWRASGDDRALDLARRTFAVWDAAAHDERHRGWVEMHRRDWSFDPSLVGYWAEDPHLKLLDTHLHIGECLVALKGMTSDPRVVSRLQEVFEILTGPIAADVHGVVAFRPDWTAFPSSRVEHGFNLKRLERTSALARALGVKPDPDHLCALFAHTMRRGWDRRDGGVFEAGRPGCRAHELVKPWWVQGEALAASLQMWRLTGKRRYAEVFLRVVDWIASSQVDWEHGGLFENVDQCGRPSGRKAWSWKAPDHVPRAILGCLEILRAETDVPVGGRANDRPGSWEVDS